MTIDRIAARARCEAATAPNCGPGGVDITGGIRSDIYVRLDRDDCSDSIYDYIYELLASVRQLGQDGIAALDALDAKDKEIERLITACAGLVTNGDADIEWDDGEVVNVTLVLTSSIAPLQEAIESVRAALEGRE